MNITDRITKLPSRKALMSTAAGATLLTLGVGGAAAQPDQALAAADLAGFWAPGEGFRNIAEGVYYIVETWW